MFDRSLGLLCTALLANVAACSSESAAEPGTGPTAATSAAQTPASPGVNAPASTDQASQTAAPTQAPVAPSPEPAIPTSASDVPRSETRPSSSEPSIPSAEVPSTTASPTSAPSAEPDRDPAASDPVASMTSMTSSTAPAPEPEPAPSAESTDAQQLVDSLGLGWNVGNSLDVPEGETAWGNPEVTPELLQAVADAGFGVVRIPVTWSTHMGGAPDFAIDASWFDRVDQVVGYALDAGLHAVINLHHDGADDYDGVEWLSLTDADGNLSADTNAAVEARFVKVWSQIATRFAQRDQRLLFESMNEIHDGYDAPDPAYYEIINHLNQVFVDTIRQSGGANADRFLIVPGYNTNIDYTLAGFEIPNDPEAKHLILSIHYYDPWSFAGDGSTHVWGVNSPGTDNWGQEDYLASQFDKLQSQYTANGLPVMIGEFGAVNQTGYENYRRYYLEYVTKVAHDRHFLPVYWDNGGQGSGADNFGLIDRSTNAITQPELVETLMRAAHDDYALESIAPP